MNVEKSRLISDLGAPVARRRSMSVRRGTRPAMGTALSSGRTVVLWGIVLTGAMLSHPAQAQSNLDAGKSPAQIFADTCSACHKSPREIKRTTAAFMREHYTTGTREATAMAAYLASVNTEPRALQQRKPPVLGAGQAGPSENGRSSTPGQEGSDQAKSESQAAIPGVESGTGVEQPKPRSRRPSESIELGASSEAAAGSEAASSQAGAGAATRRSSVEEFEE